MTGRGRDEGVVLVNVLVVLAIAGGLMLLIISGRDRALSRVSQAADAAIAEQIAVGAEASVIDALRSDLDQAPDADHLNESWALSVIQTETELPTGRFSVNIEDMQAKFDINQLADLTAGTQVFANRLMQAVDQPPEAVNQITRLLQAIGPVGALEDLEGYGVPPETVTALAPYVTALPLPGTVNLNSVGPFLLEVMLQNPGQTSQLIRQRDNRGFLTIDSLRKIGALRPQNSGFTSNVFRVEIFAEAGSARIAFETVLVRSNSAGVKSVDVHSRRLRSPIPLPPK